MKEIIKTFNHTSYLNKKSYFKTTKEIKEQIFYPFLLPVPINNNNNNPLKTPQSPYQPLLRQKIITFCVPQRIERVEAQSIPTETFLKNAASVKEDEKSSLKANKQPENCKIVKTTFRIKL